MSMLQGKRIILGITGSIAAYKSASLCRLLIKEGCEVRVIMTESSKTFISSLTMSTLSNHKVFDHITDGDQWNNHVELGLWADLMIIAPCTATSLSKMANGIADNMLVASYLSAKCPVMIAPAMDLDMWAHPSSKNNIQKLTSFGNLIIPVENGFLASGLHGDGRMAEPESIVVCVEKYFNKKEDLKGKLVLITAGPTHEALDPVRYIGNRSSGKMGLAIAQECVERGADVSLVIGPNQLIFDQNSMNVLHVSSAQQMYETTNKLFSESDIIILAAAVADYKPKDVSDVKIKKSSDTMVVELEKTIDIAATIGKLKSEKQVLIGFALETNDEINHAKAKLHKKNFDFIVLNSLKDRGAGFQHDTNQITIIDKKENVISFELKSKKEVAKDIIDYIKNV